jgi:hypothetical protein
MPRNPHKSYCQVPGCRAWAMHGDIHCRPHRDAEIGPRGGGASHGNLNALKTGDHAHPLGWPALDRLALQATTDPGCLPDLVAGLTRDFYALTHQDPHKTLAALQAVLRYLVPAVADARLAARVDAVLGQVSPEMRPKLQISLWKRILRLPLDQRLVLLDAVVAEVLPRISEKSSTGKTKPGA